MVLNFGGGIFEKPGLYDDSGLISERWGQDGSTVKNFVFSVLSTDGTTTEYTVTSGKTLYVKQVIVSTQANWNGALQIKDSGTVKIILDTLAEGFVVLNFETPLQFNTSLVSFETGSTGDSDFTVTGWEE